MLIWLWLTNLALLLGAEINAEIELLARERLDEASSSPARTNSAARISSRDVIPPATRT